MERAQAEMNNIGQRMMQQNPFYKRLTLPVLKLRDALLGRPGVLTARRTQVELVSATGQLVGGELAVAPPLRLGGVRLGNLSCVFADLHTFKIWDLTDRPAMLIGVDVMRHFDSITLDFAQSDVTFRSKAFARNLNAAG